MTNATYGTDLESILQSSCGMGLMVYLGFPRTFGPGSPQATEIRGSAPLVTLSISPRAIRELPLHPDFVGKIPNPKL